MSVFKTYFAPAASLFVICLVMTALLGLTNKVTAPKISERAKQTEDNARLQVFEAAESFGEAKTASLDGEDYTYYEAFDADGNVLGTVFTTSAASYGGEMRIMTGVGSDGKVTGVEILQITDTPGLGMNAKKPSWLAQFIGKTEGIAVSKKGAAGNEIDALSGATISSKAAAAAVNTALTLAAQVKGGQNNG